MTLRMIALAAALGLATVAATPAVAAPQATTPPAAKGMTYDCTKAGNKNKTACKNVTQGAVAATPAAKPMTPAKAAAPMPLNAAKAPLKPMNYDCTKAGNKDKQACKSVVVPPAGASAAKPAAAVMPVAQARTAATVAQARTVTAAQTRSAAPKAANPNEVAATLKNGKVVHYDCSKAGNKDKKACGAK